MTLYSTLTCVYCKQLKQYLDHKKVSYTVEDITNNPDKARELQELTGAVTVPILVKPDNTFLVGYNLPKLAEFLQ